MMHIFHAVYVILTQKKAFEKREKAEIDELKDRKKHENHDLGHHVEIVDAHTGVTKSDVKT